MEYTAISSSFSESLRQVVVIIDFRFMMNQVNNFSSTVFGISAYFDTLREALYRYPVRYGNGIVILPAVP